MMKRFGVTVAGLFLGGGISPIAVAQVVPQESADAEGAAGIAEIVVTAVKDRQTLQKTAAAVTAISSEEIVTRGITDLIGIQNYVPSARFQYQASSVEIYIRGIGSTNDYANTEPPVSFNVNGAYVPREGASAPLFDVERIEVLPGPQGTLYGRSAIGGAVNVILQRPTDEIEMNGIVDVGNYGLFHTTIVQNVPITDNLAIRAGVDYANHKGYFKSGAASADDVSGRLSLQWKPSDDFTAYVWGFATRKGGNNASLANKGLDPATFTVDGQSFLHKDAWDDTLTGPLAAFAVFGPVLALPRHYENAAIGGQFDWMLGDATVSVIPAYIEANMDQEYFGGALHGGYDAKIKAYSNEIRIGGESGKLKWQTGLNLYRQVNSDKSAIIPIFANFNDRNVSKGVGVYVHATYSAADDLRLVGGGRYSSDSRTGRGRATQTFAPPFEAPWTADVSSHRLDWKVGVEYDAADKVMLYANVQTGYQPATYNATVKTDTFDNKIEAPTITAYTAGFKSRFANNSIQINSEFFYYDYKDLPLQGTDLNLLFNPIFNAQRVKIYGNQLDVVFRPSRNDQLTTSVGYLHARQTKAIAPVNPLFGGFSGVDVSGLQLQNAPTWTITATYSHDFQLSNGYVRAAADTRYESQFFGVFTHAIGSRQKAYFMSNASLTYYSEDDRWSIGAWIKNIEKEPVQAAIGIGGIPGPALAFLQAPRTYGLRATVDF